MNTTLLPSGFYDRLPPDARQESHAVATLLAVFEHYGYAQVSPPLMEFEDSLLSGRGTALAAQTFRVMDALSQRMLAFRADMTLQVARIATTRLAAAPRPLRLCYAGAAVRVKAEQLQNDRELLQAGAELIGSAAPAADAEVVELAAAALSALGIAEVTVDLNLPGLAVALLGVQAERGDVKDAIARKDAAALAALDVPHGAVVVALLGAAGPASAAMEKMRALALPPEAARMIAALDAVVERLDASCPHVPLSVDPLEARGFEYHTGISFSLFAPGIRHELGRGGRYPLGDGAPETATGFTLYVGSLLRALAPHAPLSRVYLPLGTPASAAAELRAEGYATLHGLTEGEDVLSEARRLGCAWRWDAGKLQPV